LPRRGSKVTLPRQPFLRESVPTRYPPLKGRLTILERGFAAGGVVSGPAVDECGDVVRFGGHGPSDTHNDNGARLPLSGTNAWSEIRAAQFTGNASDQRARLGADSQYAISWVVAGLLRANGNPTPDDVVPLERIDPAIDDAGRQPCVIGFREQLSRLAVSLLR